MRPETPGSGGDPGWNGQAHVPWQAQRLPEPEPGVSGVNGFTGLPGSDGGQPPNGFSANGTPSNGSPENGHARDSGADAANDGAHAPGEGAHAAAGTPDTDTGTEDEPLVGRTLPPSYFAGMDLSGAQPGEHDSTGPHPVVPPTAASATQWYVPNPGEPAVGVPATQMTPGGIPLRLGRQRRRLRDRPGILLAGMALGLIGIAASALGISSQLMPRTFTSQQRSQIMAWEVAKRWRGWPAGQIFRYGISYRVPAAVFGGGNGLTLSAQRVGIESQTPCKSATEAPLAKILVQHGCLAVLRATYDDATHSLAVTIGVAVLPGAGAARQSLSDIPPAGRAGLRAAPFRHTPVANFGGDQRDISWNHVTGPYLVLATVGFADGKPWLGRLNDSYVRAEMLGLASGVGQSVVSRLGAMPPRPHCPGSPAC